MMGKNWDRAGLESCQFSSKPRARFQADERRPGRSIRDSFRSSVFRLDGVRPNQVLRGVRMVEVSRALGRVRIVEANFPVKHKEIHKRLLGCGPESPAGVQL